MTSPGAKKNLESLGVCEKKETDPEHRPSDDGFSRLEVSRTLLDSYSVPFARRAQNLGAEYLCYVLQFFGEGFVAYIEGTAHQRFSVVGDAVAVRVRDFGDEMVRPQ